jgi:hypothetical protein
VRREPVGRGSRNEVPLPTRGSYASFSSGRRSISRRGDGVPTRTLTAADLAGFLDTLARRLPCPAKIILTGGAEAMILGGSRPTGDIDFGITLRSRDEHQWARVEAAVSAAADESDVTVQYSADVDRWSSVAIPQARRRSRPYRRIGRLTVHLLDPASWAVYKLARYLDQDVEDLQVVLRHERLPSGRLARLCGESLRVSPRSTHLFLFRKQVEHFFREHGRAVWGRRFDPSTAIATFHRVAGIP